MYLVWNDNGIFSLSLQSYDPVFTKYGHDFDVMMILCRDYFSDFIIFSKNTVTILCGSGHGQ